jgi:hypothetical protein
VRDGYARRVSRTRPTRPERQSVGAIVANVVIGLFALTAAVLAAWLSLQVLTTATTPFEPLVGGEPVPVWWALIGYILGGVAAAVLAWKCGAYLVRVIRTRSTEETVRDPEELRERDSVE